MKFLHRWFGILAALIIILFAISGVVLNHRQTFSGVDIDRRYLPRTYHYKNWNLAAVKGATPIHRDSILVFGNTGIWLTDSLYANYLPFMAGLQKGIDNRRTASILKSNAGNVLAATMSGLYRLENNEWKFLELPFKEKRIVALTENEQGIWVMSRSQLALINSSTLEAEQVPLPYPSDFKRETSMFRALWVMHSGKILGLPGKLLVDAMALVMIFLSLSGIIWFVAPDLMKSLKKRVSTRRKIARINRFSLKWHNHLGIWTLIILLFMTVTGMFLRPPLLIPIARMSFPAWKYTILDHPNPWYDKLRDIQFDRKSGNFLLSTSEGFYWADPRFQDSLLPVHHQPPMSVMGINVFQQPADGQFITGSFSGIHYWNPSENIILDLITRQPVVPAQGMSNPFGSVPVAGFISPSPEVVWLFDYNAGAFSLNRAQQPPEMPDTIRTQSPMSLWNLALEVHTGRIWSFLIGDFYILIIPLAGLIIITILVTGGILWYRNYRRKKRNQRNCKQIPAIDIQNG